MGCSVSLWLLISLGCVWGMDHGAREMVLGTLGKATVLRIPPELQNLTLRFGEAAWKRETEDPRRKLVLLKYSNGSYINYSPERMSFHERDFSLELRNTSRQDWQLYEYSVSKGPEEKVWQIQLEVYEPVSDPSIEILRWAPVNGSCTATLNCTAERGDSVSYSWGSRDASGLCTHNGSLLHLSYPLKNTSIACTCTASNPVSSRVVTINTSQCSFEQAGSAGLTTEHLVLLVVVPIAMVMALIGLFVVARLVMHVAPKQEHLHSPLTEDVALHTIYSQVQRTEKQKVVPTAGHPSCTTIYAAATGLPADMAPSRAPQPPRSPQAKPPAPRGHPALPQSPDTEPTTVYASVMMPTA